MKAVILFLLLSSCASIHTVRLVELCSPQAISGDYPRNYGGGIEWCHLEREP